ncbi:MAG: hypothetical protein AB1324_05455 [Candidatus Micrarchaeota archaeon]
MDIVKALSSVFSGPRYVLLAAALAVLSFSFYISVPVFVVPGNSYAFFFASTPLPELLVIGDVSALMGAVLAMQAYAWQNRIETVRNAGMGLAGFLSGAASSVFATATCASCVSAIFSFVGFGGAVFLVEHRGEMMALTAGIVLLSLYFTSKRIAGECGSCGIKAPADHKVKR